MSSFGTPGPSRDASSSRYSTPVHHAAVARLRGNQNAGRASSSSSSAGSSGLSANGYSTPRSSSRHSLSSYAAGTPPPGTPAAGPSTPRTPIQGTPSRRKGTVRIAKSTQKPWYARLAQLPQDLWDKYELSLNEAILTDLEKLDDFAYPIAAATLGVHFVLRILLGASDAMSSSSLPGQARRSSSSSNAARISNTAEARIEEFRRSAQGQIARTGRARHAIYASTSLLCWCFVLLSVANAVYLFTKRRQYRLFLQRDPISSPNAKTVAVDTASRAKPHGFGTTDPEEDSDEDTQVQPRPLWRRVLSWAWSRLLSAVRGGRPEVARRQVQELSVWTPPTFNLRFFAIYSPPLALLIQFLDRGSLLPFVIAGFFICTQTYLLIHSFTQLQADRQTISREVMHEYDAKFVHPRVFYPRSDASTQTNEAEMIDWQEYTRPSGAGSRRSSLVDGGRSAVKVRHSMGGLQTRDSGNGTPSRYF